MCPFLSLSMVLTLTPPAGSEFYNCRVFAGNCTLNKLRLNLQFKKCFGRVQNAKVWILMYSIEVLSTLNVSNMTISRSLVIHISLCTDSVNKMPNCGS